MCQRSPEKESNCPRTVEYPPVPHTSSSRLPVHSTGIGCVASVHTGMWWHPACRAFLLPSKRGAWPPGSRSHFPVSLTEGGKNINNSVCSTANSPRVRAEAGIQLLAQVLIGLFRVRAQRLCLGPRGLPLPYCKPDLQPSLEEQAGLPSLPTLLRVLTIHSCSSSATWWLHLEPALPFPSV